MQSYFIHVNGQRKGPFTLDELRKENISAKTPVWKEGMKTWSDAETLVELDGIYLPDPPPFIDYTNYHTSIDDRPTAFESATEKTGYSIGKFLGLSGVIILAVVITFAISQKSKNPEPYSPPHNFIIHEKTPAELRAELSYKEQQNPLTYVSHTGTWRKNFFGQTVLEGTVSNKATIAGFKDIVLDVTWIAKTSTDLKTENYVVYDFVKAGQSINYKIKTNAPSAATNVRIAVKSATPMTTN